MGVEDIGRAARVGIGQGIRYGIGSDGAADARRTQSVCFEQVVAAPFQPVETHRDQCTRRGGLRGGRTAFEEDVGRILHAVGGADRLHGQLVGCRGFEAAEGEDRRGEFRIQRELRRLLDGFALLVGEQRRPVFVRRFGGFVPTERQHGGRRVEFREIEGRRGVLNLLAALLHAERCDHFAVDEELDRRGAFGSGLVAAGGDRHRRSSRVAAFGCERQPCGLAADAPGGVGRHLHRFVFACGDEFERLGVGREFGFEVAGFLGDVDQPEAVDEPAVVGLGRRADIDLRCRGGSEDFEFVDSPLVPAADAEDLLGVRCVADRAAPDDADAQLVVVGFVVQRPTGQRQFDGDVLGLAADGLHFGREESRSAVGPAAFEESGCAGRACRTRIGGRTARFDRPAVGRGGIVAPFVDARAVGTRPGVALHVGGVIGPREVVLPEHGPDVVDDIFEERDRFARSVALFECGIVDAVTCRGAFEAEEDRRTILLNEERNAHHAPFSGFGRRGGKRVLHGSPLRSVLADAEFELVGGRRFRVVVYAEREDEVVVALGGDAAQREPAVVAQKDVVAARRPVVGRRGRTGVEGGVLTVVVGLVDAHAAQVPAVELRDGGACTPGAEVVAVEIDQLADSGLRERHGRRYVAVGDEFQLGRTGVAVVALHRHREVRAAVAGLLRKGEPGLFEPGSLVVGDHPVGVRLDVDDHLLAVVGQAARIGAVVGGVGFQIDVAERLVVVGAGAERRQQQHGDDAREICLQFFHRLLAFTGFRSARRTPWDATSSRCTCCRNGRSPRS